MLDAHYRSFQREVLPELNRRDIGVIGMKSLGGRGQFVLDAGLSAAQCRGYALSLEGSRPRLSIVMIWT